MTMLHSTSDVVGAPAAGGTEYQRGRLANAIAVSTHTANRAALFSRAVKRCAWAGLVFLLCVPSLAATITVLRQEQIGAAVCGGGFTLLLFSFGLWLVSSAISRYSDAVSEMEVCHDGLRWRKGQQQTLALWPEIADVDVSSGVPQTGQTGLVGAMQAWNATPVINYLTIKLRSGETLVIYPDTLSDFVRFAQTVCARYLETLKAVR